jgi:methyltransferase (TIGR00027 family)
VTGVEILTGAARTALGAARTRAEESRRADRLFEDPLAPAFLAAAASSLPPPTAGAADARMAAVGTALAVHVAVRTRFYDEYLLAAGCRQVVLVAAGLDSRAFRLDWSAGTTVFELDAPDVLAFKERVLTEQRAEARCERVAVGVDLRGDWAAALEGAGLRAAEPTAWLVEGVLIYLSAGEAAALLTAVAARSAPGSTLALEYGDAGESPLLALAREIPAMAPLAALWKGGLGGGTVEWLTRAGWRVEPHEFAAVAERYGRAIPEWSYGGLATAER